jgi:hypothetical protein
MKLSLLVKLGFTTNLCLSSSCDYRHKNHAWQTPDMLKSEISTLLICFIWITFIFTLCHPQCRLLEPLVLPDANVRRRRWCGIRGQSLTLGQFLWEVPDRVINHILLGTYCNFAYPQKLKLFGVTGTVSLTCGKSKILILMNVAISITSPIQKLKVLLQVQQLN